MDKEITKTEFPEVVTVSKVKISSEQEEVKMKFLTTAKLNEGDSAFHEKKDKNKKVNMGGPSKRKAPKKFGANRAQQKAKSIAKRKK